MTTPVFDNAVRHLGCLDCDLLVLAESDPRGQTCPRCGSLLTDRGRGNQEWVLALSLTGIILYIPAMLLPLMSISVMGLNGAANIFEGVGALFTEGYWLLAGVFLLTAVVAPLVKLLLLSGVALSLHLKRGPRRWAANALRWYGHLDEWGMLEVYMIGVLVSVIKLMDMADIHYGLGLATFVGLLACSLAASALFNRHMAWEGIESELR